MRPRVFKWLAGVPPAVIASAAHAHGEEVLVSIGLVLVSFFACLVAIGVAPRLKALRRPAGAGALLGLAAFVWPFGSVPYRGNETLLNAVGLLAPPLLMLAFATAAAWLRKRRNADS
jgi:hypothetical protein